MLFTDRAEIKRLNMRYRKKNKATDVLSFPSADGPGPSTIGDVVVCVPVARQQAQKAGWSLEKETLFLLIHGLLHLMGYDHERGKKEAVEMADLQRKLFATAYA